MNKMGRFPVGEASTITRDDEVFETFFDNYNFRPNWIWCNNDWGRFNAETGKWSGVVGEVGAMFKFVNMIKIDEFIGRRGKS